MTIVLNTLETALPSEQIESLLAGTDQQVKIIHTASMKIFHCIGCNQCWLKTPGQCAINDDYKQIIKQLVNTQNLWLVTDTKFGFIDYRGKRVMDRIMPMLNMYIEFRDGWMRHQLRYHALNVGVIYQGKGDQELLQEWSERCAMNLGGHSLGVHALSSLDETSPSCDARKEMAS